jgi:phage gpG-like protein
MKFNEAGKIRKLQQEVQKACEAALTDMMVTAQNHFIQSFRDQGFTDTSFDAWKRRKEKDSKRGRYEYWQEQGTDEKAGRRHRVKGRVRSVKQGRAILVGKGSGVLKRSIARRKTGKYSGLIYIIGNANKYAKVHNDGLEVKTRRGTGKISSKLKSKASFIMPKRQFIGDSHNMFQKIDRKVKQRLERVFR